MKILVDADRLHEVIMKAVDLKHQFENNSKLYDMANYITANLSSLWFNGTQEAEEERIKVATAPLITPAELSQIVDAGQKHYEGNLTKEVLTELLLVIGKHSHPNQPIICRRAWELYGKLTGEEVTFND